MGKSRPFLTKVGGAVDRVLWTTCDQALLSLSNFSVNLVLGLWLSPAAFGGYVTASAVFWIVLSIHSGLLVEPIMVFGPDRFRDRPSNYIAELIFLHWGVSAIISAGLAAAGLVLILWVSPTFGSSMLGYAVAAPLLLLLSLLRPTCYVWSHPRLAAGASAVYMGGVFAILYVLYRIDILSPFSAPLAAAGASALAVVGIIAMQPFHLRSSWKRDFTLEVVAAHWRFGRWGALRAIVAWVPRSSYYVIVPVVVGLEANAALNVLWNLIAPAYQISIASTSLLVPALSRMRRTGRAQSLLWTATFLLLIGASLYTLLVGLFGAPLIDLIYHGRYSQYSQLSRYMGLIVLPIAPMMTFASALRAYERPDREFLAYVVATAVACVGIGAIVAWGLLGAIVGFLASHVTAMLLMFWWVLRTVE